MPATTALASNVDVTATTATALHSTVWDGSEYKTLVVTAYCVTAPTSGNVMIKLQHSPDQILGGTAHWEDLILFDAMDSNGVMETQSVNAFQSPIRAVALNSDASQTATVSVFIRGIT